MSQSAEERFGDETNRATRAGEPPVVCSDVKSGSPIPPRVHPQTREMQLFVSLCILELSLAVIALALYMKGARSFAAFLSSMAGQAFVIAVPVCVLTGGIIVLQSVAARRASSRHFRLVVGLNLITVIVGLFAGELAVRIGVHRSSEGEVFGSTVLRPKNWDVVSAEYRTMLEQRPGDLTYQVYDDVMGWTVGRNKRSANGLYASSVEGIRAPHQGVSFAEITGKTRIALVGDSFTFGEEERYEDSWGYHLEQALGPEFQVLNFGVPGYGLGQAYLRYEKDVRPWNPKVVIFSFISHDVERTTWVYPFLAMPAWKVPFSKPRFTLEDDQLVPKNIPPLSPHTIFDHEAVSQLPFLKYEKAYNAAEWQHRVVDASYLVRLVISRFPQWTAENAESSEEMMVSVNARILTAFVRSAAQAGAIPLIVYFPTERNVRPMSETTSLGQQVLQEAGLPYLDPTPCLVQLDPADRWLVYHYSPQGNAAVATCLVDPVRTALAHASGGESMPSAR